MQNTKVLRLQLQLRGTFRANQLFSATETRLAEKYPMLRRWNLNIAIASKFVKRELSCEASFKFQQLKRWKRSCREASFEFQELKRWKRSFRARLPSNSKKSRSERISSMQQFQCTKCLNTCKNTKAQHPQRREKVTWNHQFHCARSSRTFHDKAATPKTS